MYTLYSLLCTVNSLQECLFLSYSVLYTIGLFVPTFGLFIQQPTVYYSLLVDEDVWVRRSTATAS